MADVSRSWKGSEVSTSLPKFQNIYLMPPFYTIEIGMSLQKCLLNYKNFIKYLFTYHMFSFLKDFENKNSNFHFGWVYFQICRGASAQPVENCCQTGAYQHVQLCDLRQRSFYTTKQFIMFIVQIISCIKNMWNR